MLISERSVK